MPLLGKPTIQAQEHRPLDVAAVYDAHAEFVWTALYRLGVRESDLKDMLQEVFVVVLRRLDTYDGTARMTTWLFGICMRVASAYHRKAHRRRERPLDGVVGETTRVPGPTPEDEAARHQAQTQLAQILDEMNLEKRAVFVMFELDGLPCSEIAEMMGIPVGTVHSRLHTARKAFATALARREPGAGKTAGGGR